MTIFKEFKLNGRQKFPTDPLSVISDETELQNNGDGVHKNRTSDRMIRSECGRCSDEELDEKSLEPEIGYQILLWALA